MSILRQSRQNFQELSAGEESAGASRTSILENAVIEDSFSTKERNNSRPNLTEQGSFLLIWEPYISNGVLEIPYRKIFKKILEKNNEAVFSNTIDRFWGKDVFKFTSGDWELFKNNQMLAYFPISSSKYVILERFEVPRSLIVVQRITQTTRYINVINENFPRFSMSLRVVVFADIHKIVYEFFNSIINILGKNYPGNFYIYDILGNEKIQMTGSFLYRDLLDNLRYYRAIPLNVVMSRSANENTTALIEVNGIITEISGSYNIDEPARFSEDIQNSTSKI